MQGAEDRDSEDEGIMARKRLKRPLSLNRVLDGALKELGIEVQLKQHQVWGLWNEVVGPKICHYAQPSSIRGGRLFVAVEDSMWLHQLHFLRHKILLELNRRLGENVLNDIVLRVGEVSPPHPQPREKGPTSPPSQPLSPQDEETIEKILSPIKGQECREVLERVLHLHLCRNKSSQ